MPSGGRRHIRKGKKTHGGRATDRDGYKKHNKVLGERRVDPVAMWRNYPVSGQFGMLRAAMARWLTTDEQKARALRIIDDAMESSDIQIAVQGVRCLLAAEKQNQDDQIKQKSDTLIQNIVNMAEPSAPDPEYLQWKREKLMASQEEKKATRLIEDQSPQSPQRISESET